MGPLHVSHLSVYPVRRRHALTYPNKSKLQQLTTKTRTYLCLTLIVSALLSLCTSVTCQYFLYDVDMSSCARTSPVYMEPITRCPAQSTYSSVCEPVKESIESLNVGHSLSFIHYLSFGQIYALLFLYCYLNIGLRYIYTDRAAWGMYTFIRHWAIRFDL